MQLKAKPGSSRSELVQEADGSWTAWLKAPPVDGKANAELIALVAKHFGVAKSAVDIDSGGGSRFKRVRIET
ncbi:MAG: DUF167 domain-containing protein [Proteobacteria bacterium]|nr:hypothetical protein [Methylibium sp.]MCH8856579.1 DUF167 domain-containing protein [Pseudomonadota bacterium]